MTSTITAAIYPRHYFNTENPDIGSLTASSGYGFQRPTCTIDTADGLIEDPCEISVSGTTENGDSSDENISASTSMLEGG